MKIAGLVVLALALVGVPVVSYVVIHWHQLGMLQDGQKSKADVDLVSAGDTSLAEGSTTDEVEVDTEESAEKHQLSPEEMQKLMQESGANDDGPGPGYQGGGEQYSTQTDPAVTFSGVYQINFQAESSFCFQGMMDLELKIDPYFDSQSAVIRLGSGMGIGSTNGRLDYNRSENNVAFVLPFIYIGDEHVLRGIISSDGHIQGDQSYHDTMMGGGSSGTFSGQKK